MLRIEKGDAPVTVGRHFRGGLATFLALGLLTASASAGVLPAKSADAFVDSIGVNTHFSHVGSAYDVHWVKVRDKLAALGVRHIRDGNEAPNSNATARMNELATNYGIRALLNVDMRANGQYNRGMLDSSLIAGRLAYIKANQLPAVEALAGPNEYDANNLGDAAWVTTLRNYQQSLFNQVNADATLAPLTVVAPAITFPLNLPSVGNMTAMVDVGDAHTYPNGSKPASRDSFDTYTRYAQDVYPGKPLWVTESGYHNAINQPSGSGQIPVTEAVAAKYIPRMHLHYFRRGVARTYNYEFINDHTDTALTNQEYNFGLLRADTSEKPAYTTLKNMISLLKEPAASFTPTYLNYSLSGNTTNLHDLLLQKSDGTFYLVLWLEVSSTQTQAVTVGFNQGVSQAVTYTPNVSVNPVNTYATPSSITINVTDTPMIVKVTPSSGAGTLVVDDLANLSQVAYSNWLPVATANSTFWLGDGTRIGRSADTSNNYVYWSSGVQNFNGFTAMIGYAGSTFNSSLIRFYTSANASTWSSAIPVTRGRNDGTMPHNIFGAEERYITSFSPAGPLPAGTKYIKISVDATGNANIPQILKMYLSKG